MKLTRNYMKQAVIAIALSIATGMMTSCQTKQHAINQLENFSEELRDHSSHYTVR